MWPHDNANSGTSMGPEAKNISLWELLKWIWREWLMVFSQSHLSNEENRSYNSANQLFHTEVNNQLLSSTLRRPFWLRSAQGKHFGNQRRISVFWEQHWCFQWNSVWAFPDQHFLLPPTDQKREKGTLAKRITCVFFQSEPIRKISSPPNWISHAQCVSSCFLGEEIQRNKIPGLRHRGASLQLSPGDCPRGVLICLKLLAAEPVNESLRWKLIYIPDQEDPTRIERKHGRLSDVITCCRSRDWQSSQFRNPNVGCRCLVKLCRIGWHIKCRKLTRNDTDWTG